MDSPICIAQISDFHLLQDPNTQTMAGIDTDRSLATVLEAIQCQPAELYLATGDLVQDANTITYKRLQQHLKKLSAPCYCLPGNHDDLSLIKQHLLNERIFYQNQIFLGAWQIICLDSTIPSRPQGALSASQMGLLRECLIGNPDLFSVISFHHSPMPTGSYWLDTMLLDNSNELFALIDRFPKVKAVIFGHVHQAMDVERNKVRYLSCPSTCFQFKVFSYDFALDEVPHAYRWIKLHADGNIETDIQRMDQLPDGLDLNFPGYI